MFFSFAINTGILITAKISVQAAADAAAYAGAATQARQLNAISFLNYDMRRQYKKFVYRYAFLGNVASREFPKLTTVKNGTTPGGHYGYPKEYHPDGNLSNTRLIPINVPVVCIPLTGSAKQSDNCVKLNLPSSKAQMDKLFPAGGLTDITRAFLQSSAQIQAIQETQCGKTSIANLLVLIQWLMRGDISDNSISGTLNQMTSSGGMTAADITNLKNTINNMVGGLGLYPRNIITLMRIETLAQFLNAKAQRSVQKDTVDSLENDKINAEVYERTIQAFKSALSNLNDDVIKHDSVIMRELQNDNQILIHPIKPSFNAYVQYMNDTSNGGSTICNSRIIPFRAVSAPVAVVRASETPIHYAVKLTAKARLLFLPIKDGIELEAFASAKPFGSRIGPKNLSELDFVENIQPTPVGLDSINDCSDKSVKCNVPNLKISATDTYYSPSYLNALAQLGIVDHGTYETFNFPGGIANSIAPQPYEVGHYNIIPPPMDASGMANQFIPYAKDQNSKIYRFYAPIYTGAGDPIKKITDFMDEVFSVTSVSGQTAGNFKGVNMLDLKSTLQSQMIAYVRGPLESGVLSEHGETTTFAAIELPMAPDRPLGVSPQKFWLTESREVLSSWAPSFTGNNSSGDFRPRFGYSVKFVALQNLLQSGMIGTGDEDETKVSH